MVDTEKGNNPEKNEEKDATNEEVTTKEEEK